MKEQIQKKIRERLDESFGASEHYLNKTKKEFEKIAKKPLEVEYIKGAYYAYGSELAVLRLNKVYSQKGESAFSKNLNKWYFKLNVDF